jgi:hypothetical protein
MVIVTAVAGGPAAGSTTAGAVEAFEAQLKQLREVLVAAQGEVATIMKERDEVRPRITLVPGFWICTP